MQEEEEEEEEAVVDEELVEEKDEAGCGTGSMTKRRQRQGKLVM